MHGDKQEPTRILKTEDWLDQNGYPGRKEMVY